jgi:hypothetical protein
MPIEHESDEPEEVDEDESEETDDEDEEEPDDGLVELLKELRRLLDEVLQDEHRAVEEFVPIYLYRRFNEAWGEVAERFDEVIELIHSADHEESLRRHGLRGASFRLKAEGFWRNARAFFASPSRRWLRKSLGWANNVLTSLASAIPAAGIIQEFKEALERALDDKEDGESELAAQQGPPF